MTKSENADQRRGMDINRKRGGGHGIESEFTHSMKYLRVSVCDGQKKNCKVIYCLGVETTRTHRRRTLSYLELITA